MRIEEQEVTCRWGDSEATITPNLGSDGMGQPNRLFHVPPEDDPAAAVAITPAETTQLQEGHWIIGSHDRERLAQDALQFLDQEVNVRTITPAGGGFSSLQITEVKPGSLAAQVGAQDGDRILSINGMPMSSLSGAVNWFDQNPGQSQYVVVYERNGKQDCLTFHVK
ncbi:MAG TPA: PDZ domain-containing protein [Planctomycetota bacterium]|nr:PDZ domain-containing protein [Planctomycetota bacterium]